MDSVKQSLDNLSANFHKRMADFEAELRKNPSTSSSTANLATDFANFKTFTLQCLSGLQEQIAMVSSTLDRMETRERRKMLLLHGIHEESKEHVLTTVVQLVRDKVKIDGFSSSHLKFCRRLGRPSSTGRARPIVCKFKDTVIRDKVWFSKTNLKGTGCTMSEFLTKVRHTAFLLAREKVGVSKCWTREGIIHIQASDGVLHRATNINEVNSIVQQAVSSPVVLTAPTPVKIAKPKRGAVTKK